METSLNIPLRGSGGERWGSVRGTPPCWDGISSTLLTATEIFIQAAACPALMMCLCALDVCAHTGPVVEGAGGQVGVVFLGVQGGLMSGE